MRVVKKGSGKRQGDGKARGRRRRKIVWENLTVLFNEISLLLN
jgi:hypothetical protein